MSDPLPPDLAARFHAAWNALRQYADAPFPRWIPVRLRVSAPRVADPEAALLEQLARGEIRGRIAPGASVAIAVGSRGVANMGLLVNTLARTLLARGAKPFIVPAMGSHGGGTAAGQRDALAALGITERPAGVPIRSSMEVVEIGRVEGGPLLYTDAHAVAADLVIPVCRIKPHTGFRGPFESGAVKMLVVGLGKQRGAAAMHACGMDRFAENLRKAGRVVLSRLRVPFAVCTVENALDQTALLEVVPGEALERREPELLERARELMGRLPVEDIDVLVVGEIGKNISGAGMDPNVTGRYSVPGLTGGANARKLVALDITPESHGNGIGIGLADITTARALGKLDIAAVYLNAVTSTVLNAPKIPVVMETDRAAIALALHTCNRASPAEARVAGIRNTLDPGTVYLSEALWREYGGRDDLEAAGDLAAPAFAEDGGLVWFGRQ